MSDQKKVGKRELHCSEADREYRKYLQSQKNSDRDQQDYNH